MLTLGDRWVSFWYDVSMSNEKDQPTDKITDNQLLVDSVKHQIETFGVDSLTVNELTSEDLDRIPWSGTDLHIQHVRGELERVEDGEVDYLAVRAPNGTPICKAIVDYTQHEGAGTIGQFATMPELRSLGIGSLLMQKLEDKILERGYHAAIIGVESDNPRAQELYERQGYEAYDREEETWQELDEQGKPYDYVADVILLRKELGKEGVNYIIPASVTARELLDTALGEGELSVEQIKASGVRRDTIRGSAPYRITVDGQIDGEEVYQTLALAKNGNWTLATTYKRVNGPSIQTVIQPGSEIDNSKNAKEALQKSIFRQRFDQVRT